jgi:group I intron endonuclease
MKISGIYAILGPDGAYIGQSADIDLRFWWHKEWLRSAYHECGPLQDAWEEYGSQAFEFRIIYRCAEEDLIDFEQHYFKAFKAKGWWLYNVSTGVQGRSLKTYRSRKGKSK